MYTYIIYHILVYTSIYVYMVYMFVVLTLLMFYS